jgi:hypothetical protein
LPWRVVPPLVVEQVADSEPFVAHRALVERVEQAAAKLAKAQAAHRQAVEADKQAETDFASKGGKLAPPVAPDAQAAAEQARRELELLERQLPASADALFAAAYPHLEAAARTVERLLDEDDERVEAAIGEALAALDERAELARQGHWIGLALWETSVSPFDPRTRKVAATPVAAELRQAVARLHDERQEAARKRFERKVELEVLFNPDRSPKASDGRPLQQRRAEAERVVREREASR